MKLPWQRKDSPDGESAQRIEVELPDSYKKKLEGAVSKEDFDTFTDQIRNSMKSITDRYSREDEAREAARRAEAQRQAEGAKPTDEQINEMMVTNPAEAVRQLMKGPSEAQSSAILTIRADQLKREVYEDQEKYPYYTGDIKAEIDKLLDAQTLQARNDRSVIEHAYLSTVGRHSRELLDGKLKSRYASPEGSRGTNGGSLGGGAASGPRTIEADERKAADLLGFDHAEYVKMLDEAGIGNV